MKSRLSTDSWQVLQALRPNVLVIVPDPQQRTHTLDAILNGSRTPVWRCESGPLSLPDREVGTLVVPDASVLTLDEQRLLLAWAERHRTTQVVTVTPVPLYPAVAAGTFLDGLYYRLNVLVITDEDY